MTDTSDTLIRRLTADDADTYRALRLAALLEAPEAFGASHADEAAQPLTAFVDRVSPRAPSCVFGAFSGERLVGIAGFLAGTFEKTRHRGTLWGVYVAPEARGHGLAAALVEAVIAQAAGHVVVLQARVVTTNATARRLYARLGFREYGIETKALRIGDTFHDEALIALEFPPANDA